MYIYVNMYILMEYDIRILDAMVRRKSADVYMRVRILEYIHMRLCRWSFVYVHILGTFQDSSISKSSEVYTYIQHMSMHICVDAYANLCVCTCVFAVSLAGRGKAYGRTNMCILADLACFPAHTSSMQTDAYGAYSFRIACEGSRTCSS